MADDRLPARDGETTCPVERVIAALEYRTPLDEAIAAGERPIGPIYTLTDEERF